MRIAHISDLHLRYHLAGTADIASRHSRRMPDLLRQAARDMSQQAPDLVVVSGDLLDYPLGRLDDPETRARGERDLRLLQSLLDGVGAPYVILPGNHDPEALVQEILTSPEEMIIDGHRVVCFDDRQDKDYVPHRAGRARRRFEEALTDIDSRPQVHVQHYLVWPERTEGYPYSYPDAEALMEMIVGSGLVRLVLCGHYHDGIEPERVGDTVFATVPAFCEAPYPYWLYDLEKDGVIWRERRFGGGRRPDSPATRVP